MLSWSAKETNQPLNLRGIVQPNVDPRIKGGQALAELGLGAIGVSTDSSLVENVGEQLGIDAGVDAAAVAGAFEYYNRVVDATGLPVSKPTREQRTARARIIEDLAIADFPHA